MKIHKSVCQEWQMEVPVASLPSDLEANKVEEGERYYGLLLDHFTQHFTPDFASSCI